MIAKEGLIFIFIGLVLTVILMMVSAMYDNNFFFGLTAVMALLTVFTTFFFRNPNRTIPSGTSILVSPADGKVIGIDTVSNEFVGNETIKISIFLSVFDVHINRIPTTGKIDYVKYNPGKYFKAFEDKASEFNEQTEIGMTSANGQKLIFKQIAGLIARRIICYLNDGDDVVAGDRFGLIRFGSRTELYLPAGSKVNIALNQKVIGGETVIGFLSDNQINRSNDE